MSRCATVDLSTAQRNDLKPTVICVFFAFFFLFSSSKLFQEDIKIVLSGIKIRSPAREKKNLTSTSDVEKWSVHEDEFDTADADDLSVPGPAHSSNWALTCASQKISCREV